jgi:hypothetical protein
MFSSHGKLISFRPSDRSYSYFIPAEEHALRVLERQRIFSGRPVFEEIQSICARYGISYILMKKDEYQLFETLITSHPNVFEKVLQTRSFVLVSFNG